MSDMLKSIYLFIIKILYYIFKAVTKKNKVLIISNFPQTTNQIYAYYVHKIGKKNVYKVEELNIIRAAYYFARARVIICDNYEVSLASLPYDHTKVYLIWHASGALKKFGLGSSTNKLAPTKSKKRYRQVYKRYDYIGIYSQRIKQVFYESFDLDENSALFFKMQYPGITKRRRLLRKSKSKLMMEEELADANSSLAIANLKLDIKEKIKQVHPEFNENKKTILYAPTFREYDYIYFNFKYLNPNMLQNYNIIIKLHKEEENTKDSYIKEQEKINNVFSAPDNISLEKLLEVSDVLISDYSSLPIEFTYYNKPSILYVKDAQEYNQSVGYYGVYLNEFLLIENELELDSALNKVFEPSYIEILKELKINWHQYDNSYITLIDSIEKNYMKSLETNTEKTNLLKEIKQRRENVKKDKK